MVLSSSQNKDGSENVGTLTSKKRRPARYSAEPGKDQVLQNRFTTETGTVPEQERPFSDEFKPGFKPVVNTQPAHAAAGAYRGPRTGSRNAQSRPGTVGDRGSRR